jgi:hypothetical protein
VGATFPPSSSDRLGFSTENVAFKILRAHTCETTTAELTQRLDTPTTSLESERETKTLETVRRWILTWRVVFAAAVMHRQQAEIHSRPAVGLQGERERERERAARCTNVD